MRIVRSWRSLAAATLSCAVVACGRDGNGGGSTSTIPAIAISLSSSSLKVAQGSADNVTVNLVRVGGFAGPVAINMTGLPTGVTVSTAAIASGATSATLTFVVASTAPTGNTSITVSALGNGVASANATLSLTVSPGAGANQAPPN